jgi:hypothetical protein
VGVTPGSRPRWGLDGAGTRNGDHHRCCGFRASFLEIGEDYVTSEHLVGLLHPGSHRSKQGHSSLLTLGAIWSVGAS